jgi:hypothetical protein
MTYLPASALVCCAVLGCAQRFADSGIISFWPAPPFGRENALYMASLIVLLTSLLKTCVRFPSMSSVCALHSRTTAESGQAWLRKAPLFFEQLLTHFGVLGTRCGYGRYPCTADIGLGLSLLSVHDKVTAGASRVRGCAAPFAARC